MRLLQGRTALKAQVESWMGDWGSLLVAFLGLWTVTGSMCFWFGWGSPELRMALADYGNVLLSLGTVLLVWRAARAAGAGARLRRAWQLIGVAFVCIALGDIICLYYEQFLHRNPFPSWADAAYLLNYPIMFAGLLMLPGAARRRPERMQFFLDTATVLLGFWMIVWYFILGPLARATGSGPLEMVISAAYPIGDLVLLCGATIILLTRGPEGRSRALTLMAAGAAMYVLGDFSFSYTALHGVFVSGNWVEPFWLMGAFLLGLGSHDQFRSMLHRQSAGADAQVQPGGRPLSILPYFAVLLSYGLLLHVATTNSAGDLDDLVYGAVGITAIVMLRQFVTARENALLNAESAARRSEARFGSLVRNSSDVITIVDADFTITYQSPSVETIFGYGPAELIGAKLQTLFHPDEAPHNLAVLEQLVQEPNMHKRMDAQWFHKDGTARYTETTLNNLLHDENVRGLVLNTRDITERKFLEAQIRHQAFHDPLTALANRMLFRDRVEQALYEQGDRHEPVTVLFLDLDNFKNINDSMGHGVGDQLLMEVAKRLVLSVRSSDTVARLGGDEFAVLLKWMGTEGAVAVAERITEEMKAPFSLQGHDLCISTSTGIATAQTAGARADELLRNADVAMYCAKARGKGRAEIYHPSMYSAVRERMELEAELRRALDQQQLVLHYQPTVDLANGQVAGVEALLRWQHPQRGLMQPGQFIPLAEETELILPIGRWVLREACRQLRYWQDRFPGQAPRTVGVNLSVKQLHQSDLVTQVREALVDSGLAPRCLVLEITESVLMHGTDTLLDSLKALRGLGVQLAIDDFGTGYSSLSYLRWVPADVLKMDKSFLKGIESSNKVVSLVTGIINLAEALGLETVAEGIERAEQLTELQALNCHLGQGYFFGTPVDADGVEQLWRKQLRPSSQAAG